MKEFSTHIKQANQLKMDHKRKEKIIKQLNSLLV